MQVQRIEHVCASLNTLQDSDTRVSSKNVFCCAGYSDPNFVEFGDLRLKQMEIFDWETKSWRLTNHFVPYLGTEIQGVSARLAKISSNRQILKTFRSPFSLTNFLESFNFVRF